MKFSIKAYLMFVLIVLNSTQIIADDTLYDDVEKHTYSCTGRDSSTGTACQSAVECAKNKAMTACKANGHKKCIPVFKNPDPDDQSSLCTRLASYGCKRYWNSPTVCSTYVMENIFTVLGVNDNDTESKIHLAEYDNRVFEGRVKDLTITNPFPWSTKYSDESGKCFVSFTKDYVAKIKLGRASLENIYGGEFFGQEKLLNLASQPGEYYHGSSNFSFHNQFSRKETEETTIFTALEPTLWLYKRQLKFNNKSRLPESYSIKIKPAPTSESRARISYECVYLEEVKPVAEFNESTCRDYNLCSDRSGRRLPNGNINFFRQ